MSGTPAWLQEKVADYYRETTEESYLKWAGEALALHLGLSDDAAPITDERARDEALLRLNALLADRAAIGAGARVLDAGCGVGGSAIWLARERGAIVTGITLDPGQVALARRFAEERGAGGVSFEQMDFAATRFGEAAFDVVWNVESLCHAADPRAYLAHVRDLLVDGGRFVCADFFRGNAGDPADCEAMCRGWVLPNLQSLEAIAEALDALGFVAIETIDLTPRVLPSAELMGKIGVRQVFALRLRAAGGDAERPLYEDHFRAAVAADAGLKSGAITYGCVIATRPPRG